MKPDFVEFRKTPKKITSIYSQENLNINAGKQYGRGGYSFGYHQSMGEGEYASVRGHFINPLGPFKKEFQCTISIEKEKSSYALYYLNKSWDDISSLNLREHLNNLISIFNQYLLTYPELGHFIKEGDYTFHTTGK